MKRLHKAINEALNPNNSLILFDDTESFKKSSNVGEIAKEQLWIENNTVDLGLPSGTRWATCNIGAEKPSDYGLYFQWADPTGYTESDIKTSNKYFNTFDYKWYDISEDMYTKYNEIDKKTELDLEDDPAYMHSDGMLVSPTAEQYNELYKCCNWIRTSMDKVIGYKIQSKVNDNFIFLPTTGHFFGENISDQGLQGCYWTKNLHSNIIYANSINFSSFYIYASNNYAYRHNGYTVRGVLR